MFRLSGSTVRIAHEYLRAALKPGGAAVDATVGNGHDTLFLAGLVAPGGRVYGFDLQEEAIKKTARLVTDHGYSKIVTLFNQGHENMNRFVPEKVNGIIFNLGYLPGGDHTVVTKPDTTVKAVREGLDLLAEGGIMCIVVYTGHQGGQEEQDKLEYLLNGLDKSRYCASKIHFFNREQAPYPILIEKNQIRSCHENTKTS